MYPILYILEGFWQHKMDIKRPVDGRLTNHNFGIWLNEINCKLSISIKGSYVLFMGASLSPFLLLCSRKICTRFCLFVTRTLLSFGDTSQYNVLDRFHDFHITLSLNNVERTSLEISFQTGDKKPFSLSQNIRKQSCLNLDEHYFVAHIAVSLNATIVLHFINL